MTREDYFNNALPMLNDMFQRKTGHSLPPVKVSCSWPGGGSARKRIGECWPRSASQAGVNEIFISPIIDNSVAALDILTHELIHAIDDCKHGHGKEFVDIMKAVGLEGKPTATTAGPELVEELKDIVLALGDYPHRALNLSSRKKQSTRMLKVECEACGCVFRLAQKWQDSVAMCPCCGQRELIKE